MDAVLVRPSEESTRHAEYLFVSAAERGFGVALEGLVRLDNSICCFVFAPDDVEDAASHFVAPPITMKVRNPLKSAHEANAIQWWAARRILPAHNRRRALQFLRLRTGGSRLDQERVVVHQPSLLTTYPSLDWNPGSKDLALFRRCALSGINMMRFGCRGMDAGHPAPPRTKPYVRDSRIRLPPWMSGVEAIPRVRMQNAGNWNPPLDQSVEPGERNSAALSTAR